MLARMADFFFASVLRVRESLYHRVDLECIANPQRQVKAAAWLLVLP
jgi:hypothetical protein